MPEYIEREAHKRYCDMDKLAISICADKELTEDEANKVISLLWQQSRADVEPVKRGAWNKIGNNRCRCSECETLCFIAVYPQSADKNYCPNCGAKMDKEG